MIDKVKAFLNESRHEFKRVNWPSLQDTTRFTTMVVVISLAVALFLGILDFIFTFLLGRLIL